jgi:hypothetical protein
VQCLDWRCCVCSFAFLLFKIISHCRLKLKCGRFYKILYICIFIIFVFNLFYLFMSLTFYCCTGDTLWYYKSALKISWQDSPLPSFCLSPFIEKFQQISLFIHEYIIFSPYSPPSPFPYVIPPPTGINPQEGPVLPPCLLFLKKETFV